MKDHWENDEKMMRENTREPVVSFLILPGVGVTLLNQPELNSRRTYAESRGVGCHIP
jgi:hypothetical protein